MKFDVDDKNRCRLVRRLLQNVKGAHFFGDTVYMRLLNSWFRLAHQVSIYHVKELVIED